MAGSAGQAFTVHHMPDHGVVLDRFETLYQCLDKDSLNREALASIYARDIAFQDPLHSVHGLESLYLYFQSLYENVIVIEFDFKQRLTQGASATLTWTMRYKHRSINKARWVEVDGCSVLKIKDGKIVYHRDYFDAGAMLYEHIPGLSFLIKQLKKRLV